MLGLFSKKRGRLSPNSLHYVLKFGCGDPQQSPPQTSSPDDFFKLLAKFGQQPCRPEAKVDASITSRFTFTNLTIIRDGRLLSMVQDWGASFTSFDIMPTNVSRSDLDTVASSIPCTKAFLFWAK